MSDLLNGILGLEGIAFGSEDVRFELARPLPAWVWVLIIILCAVASWWSYRRLVGPRTARGALGRCVR